MGRDRLLKNLCWVSLALLGVLGAAVLRQGAAQETIGSVEERAVVIIDPGHGGEDGGAVAADGTEESAVNLAVALRLEAVLSLCGQDTLLLRREDISLHDQGADTIREKKVSDIHNRVDAINGQTNGRVISIHQNCFPSAKYHGAQVFYANGPLSQPWAELTQRNLKVCLDPENGRAATPISRDVYLMNHIRCPAILVECGFLSNPEEREKLKDGDYQTALAAVVAASYLQSTQEEGVSEYGTQGETGLLLHGVRQ